MTQTLFEFGLSRLQSTQYGTYLFFTDGTVHYTATVWTWRA